MLAVKISDIVKIQEINSASSELTMLDTMQDDDGVDDDYYGRLLIGYLVITGRYTVLDHYNVHLLADEHLEMQMDGLLQHWWNSIAICGGVLLLIGLILALTLKSKEPAVIMQQGGQMMGGQMMQQPVQQMQQPVQQMQQPVQQMPQQTTQQGYEFEQK